MTGLQKFVLVALITVTLVLVVLVVKGMLDASIQVKAAAEDLGCKFVEQSYHHPERFYVDCGNGEIRIINMEKK